MSRNLTNSSDTSVTSSSSSATTSSSSANSSRSNPIMKRIFQFDNQQSDNNLNDNKPNQSNFISIAFERFKCEYNELFQPQTAKLPFDNLHTLKQAKQCLQQQKQLQTQLTNELNRCKFTIKFLEKIINHQELIDTNNDHQGDSNEDSIDDISINDKSISNNHNNNNNSSQYVTVITLNDSAYGEIQKCQQQTHQDSEQYDAIVEADQHSLNNDDDDVVEDEIIKDGTSEPIEPLELSDSLNDHSKNEPIYLNTLENIQKSIAKKRPPTPPRKPKLLNNNKALNNGNSSKSQQMNQNEGLPTKPLNRSQFQRKFNGPLQPIESQQQTQGDGCKNDGNVSKISRKFNKKSATTTAIANTASKINPNAPFMRTFSLDQAPQQSQNSHKKPNNIYDTVAPDDHQDHQSISISSLDPIDSIENCGEDGNNGTNNNNNNDEETETSSQEMLSRSSSIDELSNYVNIDYFLRKNSVGRSNSNLPSMIFRNSGSNKNDCPHSNRKLSTSTATPSITMDNESECENEHLNRSLVYGSNDNLLKQLQHSSIVNGKSLMKPQSFNNSSSSSVNSGSSNSLRLRNAKSAFLQQQQQLQPKKESSSSASPASIGSSLVNASKSSSNNLMSTFTPPPNIHDKVFNFHLKSSTNHSDYDNFITAGNGSSNLNRHESESLNSIPPTGATSPDSSNKIDADFYAFTDIINNGISSSTTASVTDNASNIKNSYDSFNLTSDESLDDDRLDHRISPPSLKSTDYDDRKIMPDLQQKHALLSSTLSKHLNFESEQSQQMQWNIIRSMIDSETIYIDTLNTLNKYRKAFESSAKNSADSNNNNSHSSLSNKQPLISLNDLDVIFYKISDLHKLHNHFLDGLKMIEHGFRLKFGKSSMNSNMNVKSMISESKIVSKFTQKQSIGELFQSLAENLSIYQDFLRNYSTAIETANRCSANNPKFYEIIKSIKLASTHVQFSNLVDMLHEPVARLQKNALVLHDLQKCIENPDDQQRIQNALRLHQKFFNDLNLDAARRLFMTHDKFKRRLVKESFIIEGGSVAPSGGVVGNHSSGNDRRKLRHLFLFNDVLVSAKYKASSKQKFTFELRWFHMLNDIMVDNVSNQSFFIESSSTSSTCPSIMNQSSSNSSTTNQDFSEKETKDNQSTANLISSLKSRAFSTRLDLYLEEKRKGRTKQSERLRKKLSELESELSIYLPQLKFTLRLKSNTNKSYTFYLSSEYERNCWIDAIRTLQQNQSLSATSSSSSSSSSTNQDEQANIHVLQKWIESCRKSINVNCGSFLLRSNKDEILRYGDLQIRFFDLRNFNYLTNVFIVIEIDSFGHYFKRAIAKYLKRDNQQKLPYNNHHHHNSNHHNNCNEFLLELEGSQILRFLLYESCITDNFPNKDDRMNCNNNNNNQSYQLKGKAIFELTSTFNSLNTEPKMSEIQISDYVICFETRFIPWNAIMETIPPNKIYGQFGVNISQVCKKEKSSIPYLIMSCILEVERRGLREVGIYRVSGLSSEVQKLKKAFETNPRDACYLIREMDIHSVTGLLKLYLRELPESLFTNDMYMKYFEARNLKNLREKQYQMTTLLSQLCEPNRSTVIKLIEHLVLVNHFEDDNKMSLNNLATVFGPTMLRTNSSNNPANNANMLSSSTTSSSLNQYNNNINVGNNQMNSLIQTNLSPLMLNTDLFTASTIDVMAQADILYFFLRRKADGYSLISIDHQENYDDGDRGDKNDEHQEETSL